MAARCTSRLGALDRLNLGSTEPGSLGFHTSSTTGIETEQPRALPPSPLQILLLRLKCDPSRSALAHSFHRPAARRTYAAERQVFAAQIAQPIHRLATGA